MPNRTKISGNFLAEVQKATKSQVRAVANELVEKLAEATPVATGHAKEGWKVDEVDGKIVIVNEVSYIPELNAGTSKQAPAHFIEKTLLNAGVNPNGVIVTYRDDKWSPEAVNEVANKSQRTHGS